MRYEKYLPSPFLRPFINWFYILETDRMMELPSVANPCYALVFNYGESYRISNGYYQSTLLPGSFLSGISTMPYRLLLTGQVRSLGVIFRTAAFREVFKVPKLNELLDQRLDASLFLGRDAELFCEQLAECTTNCERIELANSFFSKLFVKTIMFPSAADKAVDLIFLQRGFLSMDDLTNKLYISPRHLRRVFAERTGVSPKFFSRIKRFNYARMCLKAGTHRWQDFLGENGFYDQSHLIRDFRSFSGYAPTFPLLEHNQ